MIKKLSYEFVKYHFEKEEYKLLVDDYVNAHIKIDCVCLKGHESKGINLLIV